MLSYRRRTRCPMDMQPAAYSTLDLATTDPEGAAPGRSSRVEPDDLALQDGAPDAADPVDPPALDPLAERSSPRRTGRPPQGRSHVRNSRTGRRGRVRSGRRASECALARRTGPFPSGWPGSCTGRGRRQRALANVRHPAVPTTPLAASGWRSRCARRGKPRRCPGLLRPGRAGTSDGLDDAPSGCRCDA